MPYCKYWLALSLVGLPIGAARAEPPLARPDEVRPYTRGAERTALARIGDSIAVLAGSRYAYVRGFKVRLDDVNWHDEAVMRAGVVYVPAAFAGALALKRFAPEPPPGGLAGRWVYSFPFPPVAAAPAIPIDGRPFVALAEQARRLGLPVVQTARGLLLIGGSHQDFSPSESALEQTVVTLFDTLEKFADPAIATQWIPVLRRQGPFSDHIRITAEQRRILEGPETQWPATPRTAFDFSGFNGRLLGSPVPPPGVYPRVLFSPQDVPELAARIKRTRIGQKSLIEMEYLFRQSWWNPATSDGRVFRQLATGDLSGLGWEIKEPLTLATLNPPHLFADEKPGIFNTHVAYVPECLTAMALYCLITGDESHGRQTAAAIANYFRLREPLIDQWNALSDAEFASPAFNGNGAVTAWRGMHGVVAHMNLGLSLDFAGKWMTPEEKDTMRRIIAKATYGRRAYGEDAPARFRDVNWVGWDLPQFLALTAIEGLEGFDREAYETGAATVRAFCDWGIDDSGVVFESNGKTPGSFQFITLSMVALARRGENLWGHPHWRKLLIGQTQMTSPTGLVTVTSGTQYAPYSRQPLSFQLVDEFKTFYPGSRLADYLLTNATRFATASDEGARGWVIQGFDPARYREQVARLKRLRLPSPTYPGFVCGVLYDSDYETTTRADLALPLDFSAPGQGVFSSYSDRSPDAVWINLMARPNHYLGAGHHHADAGMFHFSALGVDWFTQSPFDQTYDGQYFNLVLVDGKSEPTSIPGQINGYNAAAQYLGAQSGVFGASGSADLTDAYTHRWLTQPPQVWSKELDSLGWEVEPSPDILRIFAGTARYKMRPWWPAYTYENYVPTSRALFNPMRRVFRTVGLVRGAHPFGYVVDDLRKDDQPHLYQWAAMLNGGVWAARVPGLAANQIALAFREPAPKANPSRLKPLIDPAEGEPLLLVSAAGMEKESGGGRPLLQVETLAGPPDRNGKPQDYDRLVINHQGVESRFRVLLVPFRAGETGPRISGSAAGASVAWPNQPDDRLAFSIDERGRTQTVVSRAGQRPAPGR